mmetsp:Transcript_115237/g.304301  ORF Transcript_115237/g.304301 Transcript_115237/m.304301 type:complete len:154 (-) Transcript_115237:7-468(-)
MSRYLIGFWSARRPLWPPLAFLRMAALCLTFIMPLPYMATVPMTLTAQPSLAVSERWSPPEAKAAAASCTGAGAMDTRGASPRMGRARAAVGKTDLGLADAKAKAALHAAMTHAPITASIVALLLRAEAAGRRISKRATLGARALPAGPASAS